MVRWKGLLAVVLTACLSACTFLGQDGTTSDFRETRDILETAQDTMTPSAVLGALGSLHMLALSGGFQADLGKSQLSHHERIQGEFLQALNAPWFFHRYYLIQTGYPGQRYGLPEEEWFVEESMWKNKAFVSGPIAALNGSSLLVLSYFSPAHGDLYLVDKALNVRPLWVHRPHWGPELGLGVRIEKDLPSLRHVHEVIFRSEGVFVLVDYWPRHHLTRHIEVDVASGKRVKIRKINEVRLEGQSPYLK